MSVQFRSELERRDPIRDALEALSTSSSGGLTQPLLAAHDASFVLLNRRDGCPFSLGPRTDELIPEGLRAYWGYDLGWIVHRVAQRANTIWPPDWWTQARRRVNGWAWQGTLNECYIAWCALVRASSHILDYPTEVRRIAFSAQVRDMITEPGALVATVFMWCVYTAHMERAVRIKATRLEIPAWNITIARSRTRA